MTERSPERRPTRLAWRVAGLGTVVLGGGLALLAAAVGGDGRAGLRFFLLGTLSACSLGALIAIGSGALDAWRGHPVGRDRVVAAVVLGALTLLLPPMLVGVGG